MRKRRWPLNLILLGLIVAWACILFALLHRLRPPSPESAVGAQPSITQGKEEWMGIYLKDKKVGWAVSITDELEDGYHIVERSDFTLNMMGTEQTAKSVIECYADTDYALKSFTFRISSRQHVLKVRGEIDGRHLRYELVSAGQTSHHEIPLPERAYLPVSIEAIARNKGLVEARTYSFDIFEPYTLSLTKVEVKVVGKEELKVRDRTLAAIKMLISFLGTQSTVWVDEDGSVLKEESPLGLTMVRETRDEATRFEPSEERVEILTLYSVPSNVDIAQARDVDFLKVRLSGVNLPTLRLEDERQSLSGDTLSILAAPPSVTAVRPGEDFEADLASTPLMQADHPNIRATALEIASESDPPWAKVKKLMDWVHFNLRQAPTMSIPSAVEILETREGDCNEHAILFSALARASGVPARICAGLVYLGGGFYYHAWSKVWVGEWVAVDPTFGQPLADATHIKLVEGSTKDLLDLVGVIGELRIEVLEYR